MVYLIYGSPCSGKTTYIKQHINRGDLVCDVDYLYSAITMNDPHDAELYTHQIACQLNSVLLDIIRDRKGKWKNAYVVSIANTTEKIKKLKERINADEIIFINTSYEQCLKRAENRPPYFTFFSTRMVYNKR